MTGFYMKFITDLKWVDLVLLFVTWKMQFELNILALFVSYVQYHYYSGISLPSSDTLNHLQFELALCARFFRVTSKTCKCYFQDTNKLWFQEMEENLKKDLRRFSPVDNDKEHYSLKPRWARYQNFIIL